MFGFGINIKNKNKKLFITQNLFQISLYTFAFGLQVLTLEIFLFFSAAYIYYNKLIRIKSLLVFTFSILYFILLLLFFMYL